MLSRSRLKNLLSYDPVSGEFIWKQRTSNAIKVGSVAGCIHKFGYKKIKIDNYQYCAHRLAWLYMKGYWPKDQMDHIDGNRSNNSMKNLREVCQQENQRNRRLNCNNRSGFTGAHYLESCNKWVARIKVNSINIELGYFNDFISAVIARKKANIKYGFHENHGEERTRYKS